MLDTIFHIDSETIPQTNRARSSRVPISLPDNPYMAVRQAYLATIMDSEFGPFEDSTRPYAFSTVHTQPAMSPGLLARVIEAMTLSPLSFRKRYRSSYETPSPSSCLTLPIRKRYRGTSELVEDTRYESSYSNTEREGSEDESPSSKDEGPGLEDEGPSLEEEAAPKGQQQAVPIVIQPRISLWVLVMGR
ncbi:hypothetical protein Tco_0912514 [Tanacetum coccineum]